MSDTRVAIGAAGFRAATTGTSRSAPTGALDALAAYATQFPIVEVADTFNALPAPETLQGWASAVPETFGFLLTVPREVTHARRLRDPDGGLARLAARSLNLNGRLRGLVFRMPGGGIADPKRLEQLLSGRERTATWIFDLAGTPWDRRDLVALIEESGAVVRLHEPPSGRTSATGPAYARVAVADEPDAFPTLRRWARWAVDTEAVGREVVMICERIPAGADANVPRRLQGLVAELDTVCTDRSHSAVR